MSAIAHSPRARGDGVPPGETELLCRYRDGDLSARDALIESYMPLARRLAGRYRHTGEPQDDLEQVAYMGLIKSIDRFDPDLGPFVRYVVPNILGELKRHFRDKGWAMHVPRSLQERVLKVNEANEILAGRLGRSPTPRDVARHTGLGVEEVLEAIDAASAYSPAALDAPVGSDADGDRTLGDGLGSVDERYELVELGQSVGPALRSLAPREREILRLRFMEDLNQAEIGERVGISQMHVSRLLRRSLNRLNAVATGVPLEADA
jgi:RNA polymerase sigma-B factor